MTHTPDPLDSARRLVQLLKGAAGGAAGHAPSDGSGDCRWCPVCQAAAVLRGERPDVTAALADVLTATADALHAFAAAPADPPSGDGWPGADPATPGSGDAPSGDPPPVVQRIDIA